MVGKQERKMRQCTDADFQVIEYRNGAFGVQDCLDAYRYPERFKTRNAAQAWIKKNAPLHKTNITSLEEIRNTWRAASGEPKLQLVITEYVPKPSPAEAKRQADFDALARKIGIVNAIRQIAGTGKKSKAASAGK